MTPTKKSPAKKPAQPSPRLRPTGKPKAGKAPKTTKKAPAKKAVEPKKVSHAPAHAEAPAKAAAPAHHETKPHKAVPSASAKAHADRHVPTIRIRLSAFDHTVLDEAALKIIETAERSGAVVHGPIPLPTHTRKWTVNRSTFIYKDARDQFEMRTHRRLIDLKETTFKTVESLQTLSLPSGVDIEIKMG